MGIGKGCLCAGQVRVGLWEEYLRPAFIPL